MGGDLCRRRAVQALLPLVVLNLFPAKAGGFEVLLRIALNLRLPVLAALQLVTQPLQPRCQLRAVDCRDIFLGRVELMRLHGTRFDEGGPTGQPEKR